MALRDLTIYDTTFQGIFASQGQSPTAPFSFGFWFGALEASNVVSQDRLTQFVTIRAWEYITPGSDLTQTITYNKLRSNGQDIDIDAVNKTPGEKTNYFPVGNLTYVPEPPGI